MINTEELAKTYKVMPDKRLEMEITYYKDIIEKGVADKDDLECYEILKKDKESRK